MDEGQSLMVRASPAVHQYSSTAAGQVHLQLSNEQFRCLSNSVRCKFPNSWIRTSLLRSIHEPGDAAANFVFGRNRTSSGLGFSVGSPGFLQHCSAAAYMVCFPLHKCSPGWSGGAIKTRTSSVSVDTLFSTHAFRNIGEVADSVAMISSLLGFACSIAVLVLLFTSPTKRCFTPPDPDAPVI